MTKKKMMVIMIMIKMMNDDEEDHDDDVMMIGVTWAPATASHSFSSRRYSCMTQSVLDP